jgi:clavulanate-9-aldehyde reducatase
VRAARGGATLGAAPAPGVVKSPAVPTVSIEGKVAAVTGASSGIGEATALDLARAGVAVGVGARRADRLEALVKRIESDGGHAAAFEVDVTDEGQARGFVNDVNQHFGGLDILVNNAGVMLLGPFVGQSGDDWRTMVNVNVLGLMYCTSAALPLMQDREGGDIVNISSVAGRRATAFSAVYNATKHGVHAFSEALRQEALNIGVRVTIIAPGFVATELVSHNPDFVQDASREMIEQIGKVLEPQDIADAILYAVSQPSYVCLNEVLVRPTGQAR